MQSAVTDSLARVVAIYHHIAMLILRYHCQMHHCECFLYWYGATLVLKFCQSSLSTADDYSCQLICLPFVLP